MKPRLPLILIAFFSLNIACGADIDLNGGTQTGAILDAANNKLTNTSTTAGTLDGVLQLDADGQIGGTGNITIAGSIQGAHTITKVDSNTIFFTSTDAMNTGTVPTEFIIQAGMVEFSINNIFGGSGKTAADLPAITLETGATLHSTRFNIIGNLTMNGGTLSQDSADNSSYQGWEFLGNVNVTDDATISSSDNKSNTLAGGSHTFTVAADKTLTMTAGLADGSADNPGAGSFIKDGDGTILISNKDASYSFSGGTTIRSGTLQLGVGVDGTSTWSFGSGGITIENGGTLNLHLSTNGVTTMNNSFDLKEGGKIYIEDGRYVFQGMAVSGGQSGATIQMYWDKYLTINGIFSGDGLLKFVTDYGDSSENMRSLILQNDGNTFSGTIRMEALSAQNTLELKANGAAKNATIDLQGGSAEDIAHLNINTGNATIAGLNGNENSKVVSTGGTRTLTVNGGGSFGGILGGSLNLVKSGSETLTLSGSSAGLFNGTVSIQQGALELTNKDALGSWSRLEMSGSARFQFNPGTADAFSISAGKTLSIMAEGAGITGNVVLDGGVVDWALGATPSANSFLSFTGGSFSTASDSIFNFTLSDKTLSNGLYWLVAGDDLSGFDLSKITLQGLFEGGRQTFNLTKNGTTNNIYLEVSGAALDLTWSQGSGTWSADQTNKPWNDGTGANFFAPGDLVKFEGVTGESDSTITIVGDLAPAKVTVSSSTSNYIFGGSGRLVGASQLIKDGTASLTIENANTYEGGTQIKAGTLIAQNAGALGTGSVQIDTTGRLQLDVSIANSIAGTGNVVINWGSGTDGSLAGTFSGTVTLKSGALLAAPGMGYGMEFDGGQLKLSAAGTLNATLESINGNSIVIDQNGKNMTLGGVISGDVAISGDGDLSFLLNAAYNGTISVQTSGKNVLIGNNTGSSSSIGNANLVLGENTTLIFEGDSSYWSGSTGSITLGSGSQIHYRDTHGSGTMVYNNFILNCSLGGGGALGTVYFDGATWGDNSVYMGSISGEGNVVIRSGGGGANDYSFRAGWISNTYTGVTTIEKTGMAFTMSTASSTVNKHITPFGTYAESGGVITSGIGILAANVSVSMAGNTGSESTWLDNAVRFMGDNTLTISNMGTLHLTKAVQVNGNAILNYNPTEEASKLILEGSLSGTGDLTLSGTDGSILNAELAGTNGGYSGSLILGSATKAVKLVVSGSGALGTGGVNLVNQNSAVTLSNQQTVAGKVTGDGSVTIDAGAGKVVEFSGAQNDYKGGTSILSGTAKAGGSSAFGTGAITMSNGTTLDMGSYGLGNSLALASGAANLTTSTGASVGSITLGAGAHLTSSGGLGLAAGSSLTFNYDSSLTVNGTLTGTGEYGVTLNNVASIGAIGDYLLVGTTGISNGVTFNWLNKEADNDQFSYNLVYDQSKGGLVLVVQKSSNLWIWNGSATLWNDNTSIWTSSGGSYVGQVVKFDDEAFTNNPAYNGNVTIAAGGVVPGSVVVDNSTGHDYKFSGGSINDAAGKTTDLIKRGEGVLTLENTNQYSGGTLIVAGELRAKGAGALGSGTITLEGGSLVLENAGALSGEAGKNMLLFNGGALKYGTGIATDVSSRIDANSTGSIIVDTNGNSVVWGTTNTGFAYDKKGAGTLTLNAGEYAKDMTISGGTLAFATGNVTLTGLLSSVAGSTLSLNHGGADTVTISSDTSGFLGTLSANVENLNFVNGSFGTLTNDRLLLGAATKLNLILNGDKDNNVSYALTRSIESVQMRGGTHELTMADGATANAFTQTGENSSLTLKGPGMNFGTMKIGVDSGVKAGVLFIQGKVTTGSLQGAVTSNSRYALNLNAGGELIVTGNNSDTSNNRQNASMILAIKGWGEASIESQLVEFNMTGGKLSVENATMFFADDGHVTWNMYGGTAKLKGLDMTNFAAKKSKLFVTGGIIDIGANGFTANNSNATIHLGDAILGAYESWQNACVANMTLTDETNGTKFRVDPNVSITLSGIISDKSGVKGKAVKIGDGVLTLGGANTYSGGTLLQAGKIITDNDAALGLGKVELSGTGILDMNGKALANVLHMTGSSQLNNAQSYAGADHSVVLQNMSGNLSLGGLNGNKISSITTNIVDPKKGTVLKNIGGDSLTLGDSTLAVGVNNLYASADANNPSKPYPGSSEAILQFGTATGSSVYLGQGATLTLDLNDADLVAEMQNMQTDPKNQTFQLLITNGTLAIDPASIAINGLGIFQFVAIDGGNVVISGDVSKIYAVASNQTKTITANDYLDPYLSALVNGTLNINIPGVTDQQNGLTIDNLAGKSTGVINISRDGTTGLANVTLNVADAAATSSYDGRITGTNAILFKDGQGTQKIGGGLAMADSTVQVNDGTLILGGTSDLGKLLAAKGKLSLASGATLNLAGTGSALSGDASLTGPGSLVVKDTADLTISDTAKLDGVDLTVDGGEVDFTSTSGSKVSALRGDGTIAMNGGALNIATNKNVTSVFTGTLTGNGTVQVSGTGVQELVGSGNAGYDLNVTGGTLVLRGKDAAQTGVTYGSLNVGNGGTASIGTIGSDKTSPMTRLTLENGGTISSGGTLEFVYNTNLADALTSGPLLTTGGMLDIQNGAIVDVTSLDDNLDIPDDFKDDQLNLVIADTTGAGSISLGSGVTLVTGGLFELSFENTELKLDADGNLVLTGNVRKENLFNKAVTSYNTASASYILWNSRTKVDAESQLGKLLASITKDITSNNLAAANQAMAAAVGSTVTSLHSAQINEFYKQQMWIRNRVAQMGVNPGYVNEDMPYFNAWVQANSSYNKLDSSGDESGYKLTTWGGTVGFDVDVNEAWTFGGAFTASYGNLTASAVDSAKGDFDTYYANLFARFQSSKWSHSMIVSGGWNDMTLNRNVSYSGGAYGTRGTTNGSSYGAMYEATYDIKLNERKSSILQPLFNASIQQSKVDGYRETGAGNAGLRVSDMDSTTGTLGLGARLMGMIGQNLFGREVLGEVRAMVSQDVGAERAIANVGFLQNENVNARVRGASVGRTGVQVGGSLVVPVSMKTSVYVDVNADFRSGANAVNGNIGFRYNF